MAGNIEEDDIGELGGEIRGGTQTTADYYEDNDILSSYHTFHFGDGLLGVPNFPLKMAELCLEAAKAFGVKLGSALDAGCGPGGTALELCKYFQKVCHSHGVRYLIRIPLRLKRTTILKVSSR